MKEYYKNIENYKQAKESIQKDVKPEPEFSIEGLSVEDTLGKSSRRDFLKILGFSVGYVSLAASCETPIKKAIPFLNKPEEITPGIANFYASSFFDGKDYCSVLVKTREGRPIKIEGNDLSLISKGGTSARVQASVLSLYDTARLKGPLNSQVEPTWKEVDSEILSDLQKISRSGGKIVILSSNVSSPSTKEVFKVFNKTFKNTEVVYYDPISVTGILNANNNTFGKSIVPSYKFDKANLIVSFGADFLGTWISPVEYAKQYAKKRKVSKLKDKISRHIQYESIMSLTGSNADERIPIKPSQELPILLNLYNEIAKTAGLSLVDAPNSPIDVVSVANELLSNKGKSLVVSGSNDITTQTIVNAINYALKNYGSTVDLSTPLNYRVADDKKMIDLIDDLNAGKVDAVLINGVNPVYDFHDPSAFTSALSKTKLSVSFSDYLDETAEKVNFVCPSGHYLESWGDEEPYTGSYSLTQPTINKLFDTRQFQESLLKWSGSEENYDDFIQSVWKKQIYPKQNEYLLFSDFWVNSLQKGVFVSSKGKKPYYKYNSNALSESITDITLRQAQGAVDGLEIVLYESIGLGCGKYANNPWLMELPDPISKVCWDNYVAISPADAKKFNLNTEDEVLIANKFKLPVLIQPGQTEGTIGVALGFGREKAGKVGNNVGSNVYSLVQYINETRQFTNNGIQLIPTGDKFELALTQEHHSMEGRKIVRETTLKKFLKNPGSGNEFHEYTEKHKTTLYKTPEYKGHHWGMAIDLNACTGCSNCVISCQAENNVAVIGKKEVKNRRIMHWIRLDRYYSEDPANPEVYHQPVMCQHCDNAPCENVCPVAATPHSGEGLNQMAYNRCIGTRYCMNNCPYRVRRFNWYKFVNNDEYDFHLNSDLGRMVLNPDVVVRERGVVEKCSLCVQRIQEKKLLAKKENRQLIDEEIKPACQQSCPSDAIIFGDLSDPESKISKAFKDKRNYHLLEEIHTLPSVGYLTKVRNKS